MKHVPTFSLVGLFSLFLLTLSSTASADCTDSKVRRLADEGRTVASIARTCKMSKADIQSILDEEEIDDDDGGDDYGDGDGGRRGRGDGDGLPSGAPVGQCGCWGFVNPGMTQPHPQCRSGTAKASMCNFMCPAGGYAWRGVCT